MEWCCFFSLWPLRLLGLLPLQGFHASVGMVLFFSISGLCARWSLCFYMSFIVGMVLFLLYLQVQHLQAQLLTSFTANPTNFHSPSGDITPPQRLNNNPPPRVITTPPPPSTTTPLPAVLVVGMGGGRRPRSQSSILLCKLSLSSKQQPSPPSSNNNPPHPYPIEPVSHFSNVAFVAGKALGVSQQSIDNCFNELFSNNGPVFCWNKMWHRNEIYESGKHPGI